MVVHFKNSKERLAYVKGELEEIKPVVAKKEEKKKSSRPTKAELAKELTNPELYEAVQEKKAKQAKEEEAKAKPKKETKKDKADGKVQTK